MSISAFPIGDKNLYFDNTIDVIDFIILFIV